MPAEIAEKREREIIAYYTERNFGRHLIQKLLHILLHASLTFICIGRCS